MAVCLAIDIGISDYFDCFFLWYSIYEMNVFKDKSDSVRSNDQNKKEDVLVFIRGSSFLTIKTEPTDISNMVIESVSTKYNAFWYASQCLNCQKSNSKAWKRRVIEDLAAT